MSADDKNRQEIIRLTLSDSPMPDIQIDGMPEFAPVGYGWPVQGRATCLLTLHAVNALKQADKVVYDALVSEDISSLVRPDAELLCR